MQRFNANAKLAVVLAAFVLSFTTFVSFINAGFDPEKVNWAKWAIDVATNEAITFVMMFLGETFYISYITQKPHGKYQEAADSYDAEYALVKDNTQYFGQYLKIRHDNEIKTADIKYLVSHRIDNPISILKLDLEDVHHLAKPYQKEIDGEIVNFKSYSKKQLKVIRYVLSGNVVVRRVPKIYYLDKYNNKTTYSEYQQAGRIDDEIRLAKGVGRAAKGLSMAMISALAVGLTVNSLKDAGDVETWYVLATRLTSAIGGFYAGCRNSFHVNEIQCRSLSLKKNMLMDYGKFLQDHPNYFLLTDEEAEAKEAVETAIEKEAIAHETGA